MFSRLALQFIRKDVVSSVSSRFFQSGPFRPTYLPPHSEAYITAQIQILKERGIVAQKVALKKGTDLVGLNTNFVDELAHDAAPLYEKEALSKLSATEKKKFIEMDRKYDARVASFVVRQDIECAAIQTESGSHVYFVHASMTDLGKMKNVSVALDLTEIPSLCRS